MRYPTIRPSTSFATAATMEIAAGFAYTWAIVVRSLSVQPCLPGLSHLGRLHGVGRECLLLLDFTLGDVLASACFPPSARPVSASSRRRDAAGLAAASFAPSAWSFRPPAEAIETLRIVGGDAGAEPPGSRSSPTDFEDAQWRLNWARSLSTMDRARRPARYIAAPATQMPPSPAMTG